MSNIDPDTLVESLTWGDLRAGILGILAEFNAVPPQPETSGIGQAFPELQAYAKEHAEAEGWRGGPQVERYLRSEVPARILWDDGSGNLTETERTLLAHNAQIIASRSPGFPTNVLSLTIRQCVMLDGTPIPRTHCRPRFLSRLPRTRDQIAEFAEARIRLDLNARRISDRGNVPGPDFSPGEGQ